MKIKHLAANQTELHKSDGTIVFVSYDTPVAAYSDGQWMRSSQKYSVTTSKHVNKWLSTLDAVTVPQKQIDALMQV
jgi:hypothetical protein